MLINPKLFSIWPQVSFLKSSFFTSFRKRSRDIESVFNDFYPNSFSVLFPSARAGLSAILASHFSRSNYVWIPPFSSHCVISSIGMFSTPTPVMNKDVDATLIYHQWGYVHKPKTKGLIIEDSVDTLIEPNGLLFPNDGRYELLSLPKIFGSMFGGIVLCQNSKDAENLRDIRDSRHSLGWHHIINKIMSKHSQACLKNWNYTEPANGFLPSVVLQDIYLKISKLELLVEKRKQKLSLFESKNYKDKFHFNDKRLPTCLPLEDIKFKSLDFHLKHYSKQNDYQTLSKVLPLAIHKDISENDINEFFNVLITSKYKSN